jgi:fumarate reductase subunit D
MGEVIISIIANVVLLSLVVLATYFGFKRYDKKLLDGKTISQNQILISITGALFVSMIGVFILNYIKIFLV